LKQKSFFTNLPTFFDLATFVLLDLSFTLFLVIRLIFINLAF